MEEAAIWFKLQNLEQEASTPAPSIALQPLTWTKPATGIVKCNVACSWSEASNTCGGAWLARDSNGKALCHSRRSFSGISSLRQAEQITL